MWYNHFHMPLVTQHCSEQEKIALFRSRFSGREDVWARRFESQKTGKSGYQPVCANEWVHGVCDKPKVKCAYCEHRAFVPLDDRHVRMHLVGHDERNRDFTMGVYPLLPGDACRFAVADFDDATWQRDTAAVRDTCERLSIPVLVERSRSGSGAHLWWFFDGEIPARMARQFVFWLLTETLDACPDIGLDSYDRVSPNQDTLPKGGFGNLIALPLQGTARRGGNSMFVDSAFNAVRDPWVALSETPVIAASQVAEWVLAAQRADRVVGVPRINDATGELSVPFELSPSPGQPLADPCGDPPCTVHATLFDQIYFRKDDLVPALRGKLLRLAAFQNPEFLQAQRMRLSTYGKPRVIACGRETADYLVIPRGCREASFALLAAHNAAIEVDDRREAGVRQGFAFHGALRDAQTLAVREMLRHDDGILAAGTAFGKTVAALWLVAERNTSTLILVNRRQLLDQWIQRIAQFLGIPEKEIGRIGGGRRKDTGRIDVATIQSLQRKGVVDECVRRYGFVVIDECHSLSAPTFELVARHVRARYVLGLSATPVRKDGHHPIIMMQCGPVRYVADAKSLARAEPFAHVVVVRPTDFRISLELEEAANGNERPVFAAVAGEVAGNGARNAQIAADVVHQAREGRTPIVLTDRREHVAAIAELIGREIAHVFPMQGGIGKKAMKRMLAELDALPDGEPRVLVATGQFLGEGFDYPRLDTLFLAMPISWRGRIAQYAGRLHRLHEGKREVRIYDYADLNVPLLARMFDKRCEGYAAIGYAIRMPVSAVPGWPSDVAMPVAPEWMETYADSVRRLCRDGTDSILADLFVQAAWLEIPKEARDEARARSNAEAFLFRRLETLPLTQGRFELNARLPIPFAGAEDMEVDLVDQKSRIIVEIDGIYHFCGEDAYRRDRRKDFLLQKFGYMVLRFLAGDVSRRLNDILNTLAAALHGRDDAPQSHVDHGNPRSADVL